MQVIRHSDDLGITSMATNKILKAWQDGYLDGFSIIANGDAVERLPDAFEKNISRPARIAVHFNLTEGCASASLNEVPLLVDADGKLRHTFGSLLWIFAFASVKTKLEMQRQISCECKAQINAVRGLCGQRSITAVDGHNHIHMIPGVFKAVAHSALDAGIPEIRISSEPFYIADPWRDWVRPFLWINLVKHFLLAYLSRNARRLARSVGLSSPDVLIGVIYSGNMSAIRALRGIRAAKNVARSEIVFHVGRAEAAEAARWQNKAYMKFHLSELRDSEWAELKLFSEINNL